MAYGELFDKFNTQLKNLVLLNEEMCLGVNLFNRVDDQELMFIADEKLNVCLPEFIKSAQDLLGHIKSYWNFE